MAIRLLGATKPPLASHNVFSPNKTFDTNFTSHWANLTFHFVLKANPFRFHNISVNVQSSNSPFTMKGAKQINITAVSPKIEGIQSAT